MTTWTSAIRRVAVSDSCVVMVPLCPMPDQLTTQWEVAVIVYSPSLSYMWPQSGDGSLCTQIERQGLPWPQVMVVPSPMWSVPEKMET